MKTDDYRAKLEKDDRTRLEKTALAILAGTPKTDNIEADVYEAIQIAKEFIKQIDEEGK